MTDPDRGVSRLARELQVFQGQVWADLKEDRDETRRALEDLRAESAKLADAIREVWAGLELLEIPADLRPTPPRLALMRRIASEGGVARMPKLSATERLVAIELARVGLLGEGETQRMITPAGRHWLARHDDVRTDTEARAPVA